MLYRINPIGKPRMTRSDKWKKRECVMKYRDFKDMVREAEITLDNHDKIIFYIPFPPSYSKKKKEALNGEPHTIKPDIDNLVKSLLDAIYEDDSHIWKINAEKRWSYYGGIEVVNNFYIKD